jgi:hypothetical protein
VGRLLLLVELGALISLLALFVAKALIPAWITLRTDFPNYYIVARLLREHYSLDRIYDWIWLQRVKDHWSIPHPLVGFVGLTPFSALPLVPFTWLDAIEAKRAWLAVNLAVLAASLYGLQRLTGLGFRRVALIALLAIIPLRNNFLLGQMHLVVLGLLLLAFWLNVRGKWLSCAFALSVAASLKIYPLFFVFYFARKHQWKSATALAVSTLAFFAGCFLIFGEPVMRAFLLEQFPRMLRGEAMDPFSLTAPSASSVFHRVFLFQPETNPHPVLPSPLLYAMLYPLWQLGLFFVTLLTIAPTNRDPRRQGLEWATWVCLLLALSTEPASYHRVVLILVAVFAVQAIERTWHKALLLGCYFVACNAHPAAMPQHPVLALLVDFVPYWATLGLLACLLTALRSAQFGTARVPVAGLSWSGARLAWAIGTFTLIWAGVSTSTFMHARTLSDAPFLIDRTSAVFAQFSPHVAGGHLLTIAMLLDGFRVEGENGALYHTWISGIEDDQLAVASRESSNRIWIEAVNGGRSRLIEVEADPGSATVVPIATIFDAESPALSPDGSSLVFLRENRGKGRAWGVQLDENGQPLTIPAPISPPEMNVWAVQFSDSNGIVLSAAENGRVHLFAMRNGALQRLSTDGDSVEGLATHEGNSVVVRERRNDGTWRLYRSDSTGEGEKQLTFGDCNAYDPAWLGKNRLVYISDCGRGKGMGALAEIDMGIATSAEKKTLADIPRTRWPQGDLQE